MKNLLPDAPILAAVSVSDASELIRAIAAIAWPIVALVVVILFRKELSKMLGRVVRGKAGPIEFELHEELTELRVSAELASESVPELSEVVVVDEAHQLGQAEETDTALPITPHRSGPTDDNGPPIDPMARDLLREAATSPRVALMTLSAELDRRSRDVLASNRPPDHWEDKSLSERLNRIDFSPSLRKAVREFRTVRNRILHGREAVTDAEVLSAIDSGMTILDAIKRLPGEVHTVLHARVDLFADPEGTEPRKGVHGVVLESASTSGQRIIHAFPTTKTHFQAGKAVAWEWNERGKGWPESWYRDPDSGEVKYGWTGALEFIGRHLDDL